jgi:hypothetical protein
MVLSELVIGVEAELEQFERVSVQNTVVASGDAAPGRASDDLIVVGTGIRIVGQLTIEAAAWMCRAERLFFSVADVVSERVIRALNGNAEALMPLIVGFGILACQFQGLN